MAKYKNMIMTETFLDSNINAYFVFGDNVIRKGYGGAAALRDHPHSYGFITKKFPDNRDLSFYTVDEYEEVFQEELKKLKQFIDKKPNGTHYISQIGAGLANKYHIWEYVIKEELEKTFDNYNNVVFLWEKDFE